MEINELKSHFTETVTGLKSLVEKQAAEIEKNGVASKETTAAIKKADERYSQIEQELEEKSKRLEEIEKRLARPEFGEYEKAMSLGDAYVQSEAYDHAKSIGRGNNAPVEWLRKDITSAAASAGALTDNMRNPNIYPKTGDRPLFVRQLVNTLPTQDSAVEIMRENVFTNSAAPQYDVSKTPKNELVAKEKSDITFSLEVVPVRTIAHYFITSRQVLADAPRLRSYIDGRGLYGLNLQFDTQMLYGDGTTDQNFTGLFVDASVSDVGELPTGTTGTAIPRAMIQQVRKAITQLQLNEFYNVNGLLVNPQDWEAIETAQDGESRYLWVTVPMGGESRLWRVPVIVSNAVTQGDFILGDWNMGATLYTREGVTVRTSDSHSDYFVKNGLTILIEERAAFGIEIPRAFCKGSFDVAAS